MKTLTLLAGVVVLAATANAESAKDSNPIQTAIEQLHPWKENRETAWKASLVCASCHSGRNSNTALGIMEKFNHATIGPVYPSGTASGSDSVPPVDGNGDDNGLVEFQLAAAEPPDDLRLAPPRVLENGSVEVVVSGTIFQPLPARIYYLEASVDLIRWSTLQSKVATSDKVTFIDSTATSFNTRFYRVRESFCLPCAQ